MLSAATYDLSECLRLAHTFPTGLPRIKPVTSEKREIEFTKYFEDFLQRAARLKRNRLTNYFHLHLFRRLHPLDARAKPNPVAMLDTVMVSNVRTGVHASWVQNARELTNMTVCRHSTYLFLRMRAAGLSSSSSSAVTSVAPRPRM
jgi:hypothetical protein